MIENIIGYFRIKEWYDSKIPMMMSVFLYFYFINCEQYDARQFYVRFISYFLYLAMFLAFSYLINDYSDMDIDRKAGKSKFILQVPEKVVVLSLAGLIIVGNLPLLMTVRWNIRCVILSCIIYGLGAAYSVKGIRFKEKGAIGLVECSIAQKCVPVLLIPYLVKIDIKLFICWLILLFLDGMRYITIHQVIDCENDLKTGVKTYISTGKMFYKNCMLIEIFLEVVLVIVLYVKLGINHWILWLFVLYYLLEEWVLRKVICTFLQKSWLFSYEAVPMEDLFNVYIPVIMLISISMKCSYVWILVPIAMIYLYRGFKSKIIFIDIYVKVKLRKDRV